MNYDLSSANATVNWRRFAADRPSNIIDGKRRTCLTAQGFQDSRFDIDMKRRVAVSGVEVATSCCRGNQANMLVQSAERQSSNPNEVSGKWSLLILLICLISLSSKS